MSFTALVWYYRFKIWYKKLINHSHCLLFYWVINESSSPITKNSLGKFGTIRGNCLNTLCHIVHYMSKLSLMCPCCLSVVGLDIQDEMGRHEVGHIDNSMKIPLNQGDGCRFEGEFTINKVRPHHTAEWGGRTTRTNTHAVWMTYFMWPLGEQSGNYIMMDRIAW